MRTWHDNDIQSDLILLEKKEKICYKVDVVCLFDPRIVKKEKDKVKKIIDYKYETLKMWKNEVTNVYITSVVIGAFGIILKNINRYLEINGFGGLKKLESMFIGNS